MKLAGPCVFLAIIGVLGCQGSVEGKVETGGEAQADFEKPMDSTYTAQQASAPETSSQGVALLGARQDLSFRGPATAQCKCLAVVTGLPSSKAFQWSGPLPEISPSSQLVVALSSAGLDCPEAGGKFSGASYWGYEQSGADVVVVVESASPNHPLASGAIIPRPGSGGNVYVRPVDKSLPYGKPASGTGSRCKVGPVVNLDSPSPAAEPAPAAAAEPPPRPVPPPMPAKEPPTGTGSAKGGVTKGIKLTTP